jgi:hypothetical protein
MSDMSLHLEKIIEMTTFQFSSEYQFLSESSKFKFERKIKYHLNQYTNQFFEIFRPLFELFQNIFDAISDCADVLRDIDWSDEE